MHKTRLPRCAKPRAMAAATVVLPTPPAPAHTTIRRPFKTGRRETEGTAPRIYHVAERAQPFRKELGPFAAPWPKSPSMLDPHYPQPDRRQSRSENTLVALTRLLESARRSAELEAVAIGDDAGLLVAGAGAAELCDELAAIAPLEGTAANDTVPTRWDVLSRRTEVRRLAVDGLEVFISGRGGDLGLGLSRVAAGCARILAKKSNSAR